MNEITELRSQGEKAIQYMKSLGYRVRALNIVYFEGLDADDIKTVNNDRVDSWNDIRAVISDLGRVYLSAIATTEPGWFYRQNRMNFDGAAQLEFGQYLDCWRIGRHYSQDALVQCGNLKVRRDNNEDGSRLGDKLFQGDDFGINQHTTNYAPDTVGRWSAGCLVGKHPNTHAKFMSLCRAMGLATFDTTLIDGSKFAELQ